MTLRYKRFIAVTLLLAAMVLFGSMWGQRSARAEESRYDPEELKFLKLINDYRQGKGLTPLILSDALTSASERHSEDMGRYNFFAHESLKSSYFPTGSSPWDRMKLSGYQYPGTFEAENVAAGYESAQQNFEAWRASPGHDKNMLDANQRVIGIARLHAPDSKLGWYWTTDFGSTVDPTSHAPGQSTPSQEGDKQIDQQTSPSLGEVGAAGDVEVSDLDGLENGQMNEDEGVWKQKSTTEGKKLIRNGVAQLGGREGARDDISQKIHIKEGQDKLIYWVKILPKETERQQGSATDVLYVSLTDEDGEHPAALKRDTGLKTRTKADRNGWVRRSIDLSSFEGETGNLHFVAKTDKEQPTTFYMDGVTLQ